LNHLKIALAEDGSLPQSKEQRSFSVISLFLMISSLRRVTARTTRFASDEI
jgi:hypothetical protein